MKAPTPTPSPGSTPTPTNPGPIGGGEGLVAPPDGEAGEDGPEKADA